MLKNKTLFSDPLFDNIFEPKNDKLTSISNLYSETIIEKSVTELDMIVDLGWLDIVSKNQDEIGTTIKKEPTEVIGIETVSITDVFQILSTNNTTNWYDPFYTMSTYLKLLSTNIDSRYDSDADLIKDLAQSSDFKKDTLEKTYSKLRNAKEKDGIVHPDETDISSEDLFDSLFARFCFTRGSFIEKTLEPFIWKDVHPDQSKYIILHLVNSKGERSPVVGKVEDTVEEEVQLSSIIPRVDSNRGSVFVNQKYLDIHIISYDDNIKNMYPTLSLDTPSSTVKLTADLEDMIEFKEENPLPL